MMTGETIISNLKPTELINFIDYYKHPMNIKGGSKLNN